MKRTFRLLGRIIHAYLAFAVYRRFPLWVRIGLFLVLLPVHAAFFGLFTAMAVLAFVIAITRVPADFLQETLFHSKSSPWLIQLAVYLVAYPAKFLFDLTTAFQYIPLALLYFFLSCFGFAGSLGGIGFQPLLMEADETKIVVRESAPVSKRVALGLGIAIWLLFLSTFTVFVIYPSVSYAIYDYQIQRMYDHPVEITTTGTYSVTTDRITGYAVYSFVPAQTGLYRLSSTGSYDTYVRVLDNARTYISSADDSNGTRNFDLYVSLVAARTYYIVLSVYGPNQATFDLVVAKSASGSGTGTGFGSPITITDTSTFTVTIASASQKKYYLFVPSTSGTYTISSSGSLDTKVDFYSSSLTLLDSDDDDGAGLNFTLTRSLTAGVTYYFVFSIYSSGTGNYTVTLAKN